MKFPTRFLFYSHDSYGLGHLRRTLLIAEALVAAWPRASVVCLTGSPAPELFQLPPRCELIRMPAITKDRAGGYVPRNLPLPLREVLAIRSAMISGALRAFRPDTMLVDHAAIGPGGELLPVLRRLRYEAPHMRLVLGMRDILDAPERARLQMAEGETAAALAQIYDEILVYGDPQIMDVAHEYGLADAVRRKTRYVGVVCARTDAAAVAPRAERDPAHIVVGAGGGEDGYELLRGVLGALRGPLRDAALRATLAAGPLMPLERRAALERATQRDPRLQLLPMTRDMAGLVASADLVIGMGGYNSVYEALERGCRLLVMPRVWPRLEQQERAQRLHALGLLDVLPPGDAANPEAVATAIRAALLRGGPARAGGVRFDGAQRVAARLCRSVAEVNPGSASMESAS